MANLTDKLLNFMSALPDEYFGFRFYSYRGRGYDRDKIERYIRERCEKAMAPVEAKRETNRQAAAKRERELEKMIVAWAKKDGSIVEGMRVKFKGTRDDGYRKVHSVNGEQVIGFQFHYYRGYYNKDLDRKTAPEIIDQTTTTSNHVSNIRQVMADNGQWVKIRDYLKWPNNYRKQT